MTGNHPDSAWEARAAQLWATIDAYDEDAFTARIEALVAKPPP